MDSKNKWFLYYINIKEKIKKEHSAQIQQIIKHLTIFLHYKFI